MPRPPSFALPAQDFLHQKDEGAPQEGTLPMHHAPILNPKCTHVCTLKGGGLQKVFETRSLLADFMGML